MVFGDLAQQYDCQRQEWVDVNEVKSLSNLAELEHPASLLSKLMKFKQPISNTVVQQELTSRSINKRSSLYMESKAKIFHMQAKLGLEAVLQQERNSQVLH